MREIMAIAETLGSALDISVDARIEMTHSMTDFRTSTLQDFEAGNPLEPAALVDAAGHEAQGHDVLVEVGVDHPAEGVEDGVAV